MNSKFLLSFIALLIVIVIAMDSCRHDSIAVEGPYATIYFNPEVLSIFKNNCAIPGCHDGSGEGRLMLLNSYDAISGGIQKFNPQGSRLYTAITATYGGNMPPKTPLSPSDRTKIRLWILEGALNNSYIDTTHHDTTVLKPVVEKYPVCFGRDIMPIISSNCSMVGSNVNCHDGLHEPRPLNNYSEIMVYIRSNNPNNTKLYQAITGIGEDPMPPASKFPIQKAYVDSIYSWISSGSKNDSCASICDTSKFTFSGQVSKIISTNCSGCHSGANAPKGVQLIDYKTISDAAKNGTLMNDLKHINNGPLMPPSGPLSTCEITVIQNWVNAKEPDN